MSVETGDENSWLSHLATKVGDQSTAIQALQSDIHRLVKLAERQDGYNERQIALAEKTAEHAKTFDRVFSDLEKYQSGLSKSIEKLADNLGAVSKVVTGHQTGIRVSWALFVVIGGILTAYADSRFGRMDERLATHIVAGNEARAQIERRLDRAEIERRELRELRNAR